MALTSVWRARHPRPATGPGELAGEYDVAVVGAGITGLTLAGLLARAGRSVLVVEAHQVGAGTTGGSTAKVSLLQGTVYSRIARRQPAAVLRQYAAANQEAQAWVARFCDEHGVGLQRRPAYTYANGALGEHKLRSELKALRRAGLEPTWVEEPPLPFPTRGAVRLDEQCQVDPLELVDALAADARAHGATLVEGVRVQRITGRSPVRLVSEHGAASAGTVVVATNMPMVDRGGFFARAKPSRSYGMAYRTPTQVVDGMYLAADSPHRSLRDAPAAAGEDGHVLMIGGNGHKVGAPVSEQARLDELRAWTARHYPEAVETHAWSAQDYLPHHGLPYAGPVLPGQEEVLVAGGYSKWGMTNGVAAALALSGRILGGHMEWAEAFRTWGRNELTGVPTSAALNAEVGLEMTWGWLRPVRHPGEGAPDEGQGVVRYDGPGRPTAVSRVDGIERQVSAVCTHLGGILRWNDAEHSWDCPLHGSRFDPDGAVLEGPATCALKQP